MSDTDDDSGNESKSNTFMDKYNNDNEFREKHKKKMAEKIECECGVTLSRVNMSTHRKSQKHKQWIKDHTKITCECGKKISSINLIKHKKTSKTHKKWLKEEEKSQWDKPLSVNKILNYLDFVPIKLLRNYVKKNLKMIMLPIHSK